MTAGCRWASSLANFRTIARGPKRGFRRRSGVRSLENFESYSQQPVVIERDVHTALARMKPEVTLYVGGMGACGKNFHKDLIMSRQGFPDAAERIQELYLAG